ncbi:MAG: site-specific integrase [Vicinamibacterales bacterium]
MTRSPRPRQQNRGLRKRCDCDRRNWSKCKHAWYFNFKWRGTHYRISLDRHLGRHVDSRSLAEDEAERIRVAIKAGTFGATLPARDTLTLRQLLDAFTTDVLAVRPGGERPNDTHATSAIVSAPLRRLTGEIRPFGDWLVADITSAALEQFRTVRSVPQTVERTGRGSRTIGGPRGVNRLLAFLRRVFNWAIAAGHLEATPFRRMGVALVKLPREPKRTRRLQEGEGDRLLAACGPHLRAVVEAALETGMRRGELLGLQWCDVALQAGEIRVPAAKTKTATGRTVPISRRLAAVLALRRDGPDGEPFEPTAYVFGTEIGTQIGDVKTAWRRACARAGIEDLHLHDLRREAGSRWLEGGVPLHTVRDWLGHTSVAQTSTYLATTAKTSHEAMRRFEDYVQQRATDRRTADLRTAPPAKEATRNTRENTGGHGPH